MEIEVECKRPGVHLVRFRGELSSGQGEGIRDELHPLAAERGAAIIIDLSKVRTIDSGGLSHLISLATHARLSESRVILFGATPFVAGVLEMTKLDTWFEIAESEADAEARVGGG